MQQTYGCLQTAQYPRILRKQKVKYTVKFVTVTVSTKVVLITITMFARKFISAKIAIKLH